MKNIHPDQILSHILQMVKDVLEKTISQEREIYLGS